MYIHFFLCCFFFFFSPLAATVSLSTQPFEQDLAPKAHESILQEIRVLIRAHSYRKLESMFSHHIGKDVSLAEVTQIATEENNEIVIHAIAATRRIMRLSEVKGIAKGELLAIALFIESELPYYVDSGITYILGKKVDLSKDIEYNKETELTFIHLRDQVIGTGYKKVVSKSILYSRTSPEIVAHLEQSGGMDEETRITRDLSGHEGIFEVKAFSEQKIHGKTRTALFSRMYRPGSLQSLFDKKIQLTFDEKIAMAVSVAKGLEHMHRAGYVHKDLGPKNHLVDVYEDKSTGERHITHVLADFGRSRRYKNLSGSSPQGNNLYKSPEAFIMHDMRGKDYLGSDVFALGCVFHELFFNKLARWQKWEYVKDWKRNGKRVKARIYRLVKKHTRPRRLQLYNQYKKKRLTPKEDVELLILRMLHYNSDQRPSASTVRKKLESIQEKL